MHTNETLIMSIIALPIVLCIVYILHFCSNKSVERDKNEMRDVLKIIAMVIVALEIVKNIYGLLNNYYSLLLPFQICSLFLVCLPLSTLFEQNKKVSKLFGALSYSMGLMVSVAVVFLPVGIMEEAVVHVVKGNGNFFDWHSVIFHYLIVLFYTIQFTFRQNKIEFFYFILAGLVFVLHLSLVVTMTNLLQTNFASFIQLSLGFRFFQSQGLWLHQVTLFVLMCLSFFVSLYTNYRLSNVKYRDLTSAKKEKLSF
ncbi:MAG: YwaF family protein [Clostridiales bacterium]|nr:YwaF family protein [Clostridiales bacterium]